MNDVIYFLSSMFEPFQYSFMLRSFTVAILSGTICALLSCWLVLKGWALLGDAISHSVLPGVVISYYFSIPYVFGALAFAGIAVALISWIKNNSKAREDAAIGIVFTTLFALGIVLISLYTYSVDLQHILFGNILGVSTLDLIYVIFVFLLASTILIYKNKDLTLFVFDEKYAKSLGLNISRLNFMFLFLVSLTVVSSIQITGVILVVAMLIVPGMFAQIFAKNFKSMMIISVLFSVIFSFSGIYISYFLNSSPGGTIVVLQGFTYIMAIIYKNKSRKYVNDLS